ncbi:MAG: SRPBCC family protein [Alphaproteobacteria bacterium]|nr:SRPBCC family protein [Alphaproteobacteria bacterium]
MVSPEREDPRDLVLTLTLDAPRAAVWRCWTEAELLTQWFTPRPWTTEEVFLDVRPGGTSRMVMCGPDGSRHPESGVYLEVVPGRRLVFTDTFRVAWEPSEAPFMTGIITLADDGTGGTLYEGRARHWSMADRDRHAEMGFHDGWTKAARQLEAVARTLGGSG